MQGLKNMRLGTRLIAGFLLVVALGAAVAAVGIYGLQRLNQANDRLYNMELLGTSYVKEANVHLISAGRARLAFTAATSSEEREAEHKVFLEEVAQTRQWLERARPMFYLERGRVAMAKMDEQLAAFSGAGEEYLKLAGTKDLASHDEALRQLDRRARALNKAADDQIDVLAQFKEERGKLAATESVQLYRSISLLMIVLTVSSALLGVLVGVLLTRTVTRRLGGEPEAVAALANAIAAGNLGTTIDASRAGTGSVVQAMQQMQGSLRQLVGQVRTSSDSIATASGQIATGNADLSQRTE